jgi:predicted patatin/cPLA2 family phospholipase
MRDLLSVSSPVHVSFPPVRIRNHPSASEPTTENRQLTTIMRRMLSVLLVVFIAIGASARAEPRTPYTESDLEAAVPMGIPAVRTWADAPLSVLAPQVSHLPIMTGTHDFSILALSGGGEHGAFGAGLLNGWSETAHRPNFSIVTGISTGALMSPCAFLGSAYDERLKALYTDMSMHSVLSGSPLMGLFGEGLYSTGPLQRIIARQIDQTMLADIAAAHRQGRRLFVVTTNLDAQRPVLWNMGAIANSGQPRALELFRKVLLASASVPGLFDPVFIDAEANGHHFKEMHVDGGTALQVLAIPLKLAAAGRFAFAHGAPGRLYIVINNNLDPAFLVTKPKTLAITARAFNTMVKSDIYDTILGSYLYAQKQGFQFNLAYIPNTFKVKSLELIDPQYMAALFEFGRTQGRLGGGWEHLPPRLYR